MKKIILLALIVLLPIEAFSNSNFEKKLSDEFEIWNSQDGINRLNSSKYNTDFYQLVNFYQPQINPVYCGIASATILLNAINDLNGINIESQKELEIEKPNKSQVSSSFLEFHSYSQQTLLNDKTNKIKHKDIINFKAESSSLKGYDPGLALSDLSSILKSYGLKTQIYLAKKYDDKSLNAFRSDLKKYLLDKDHFVLVNVKYGTLIKKPANYGHISPLAAYDENTDSVLVLDVALHKNQWYWAPLDLVYRAMNTKDGNSYRGYMIISKK